MTQLILNAKISNITKITLFFANFEKKSNFFEKSKNQVSIVTTITKKNTIKKIQNNIFKMEKKTTSLLKEKNKIYFFTKNLKINKRKKQKTQSCQSRIVFH